MDLLLLINLRVFGRHAVTLFHRGVSRGLLILRTNSKGWQAWLICIMVRMCKTQFLHLRYWNLDTAYRLLFFLIRVLLAHFQPGCSLFHHPYGWLGIHVVVGLLVKIGQQTLLTQAGNTILRLYAQLPRAVKSCDCRFIESHGRSAPQIDWVTISAHLSDPLRTALFSYHVDWILTTCPFCQLPLHMLTIILFL